VSFLRKQESRGASVSFLRKQESRGAPVSFLRKQESRKKQLDSYVRGNNIQGGPKCMGAGRFSRKFLGAPRNPRPGLYTYEVQNVQTATTPGEQTLHPNGNHLAVDVPNIQTEQSGGGQTARRRFHLRVHPDGSGLLFVDLADPVHLNPTATMLVWHALEGRSRQEAIRWLWRWAGKAAQSELQDMVEAVFGWVARLQCGAACCPQAVQACQDALAGQAASLGQAGCASDRKANLSKAGLDFAVEVRPIFSLPVQAPYKADVVLCYGCNNQCGHCYNMPERRRLAPMSMATWRQVVGKLAELGVPQVILTGGEPTLCDDLPERIRLARRWGLVVGLNTNGRRLADPGFTGRLAEAGLDHVQITLLSHRPEVHNRLCQPDGGTPGGVEQVGLGNPFAETTRGIQNALAAGLHTLTNTTLTKHNAEEAEALVDFLYGLGVRTFAMNGIIRSGRGKAFPAGLAEEELGPVLVRVRDRVSELGMRFLWYTPSRYCRFSPLELELGVRRCNAAQYSICIEPNGDVLPCQSYYQPVGNLLRDPWPVIWESALFRRIRQRVQDPVGSGLPERCWQCPDLPVCGGGCLLAFLESTEQGSPIPLGEDKILKL